MFKFLCKIGVHKFEEELRNPNAIQLLGKVHCMRCKKIFNITRDKYGQIKMKKIR